MIKIAIDAMGGDNAPSEIVRGAVNGLKCSDQLTVIFVGQKVLIEKELRGLSYPEDRVSIQHASEVIGMAEHPVESIRHKKDSSMVVGMNLLKKKEADAFVSAGNSGAVVVGGQGIVGRIRGVQRPPFATLMPTTKGCTLLLDAGANVDSRPEHLVQWAKLGSIYMEHVIGVKEPKVGIVNIGAEEEKGNTFVKETFPLLKESSDRGDIHFIGSWEARDIPAGGVDVVVCDGFTGNVIIKMYEGTAKVLMKELKGCLSSSFVTKMGAALIAKSLKGTLKKFDTSQYGAAPILGLKGLVLKMHGSAKAADVERAMEQSVQFYEAHIPEKMSAYFSEQKKEASDQ